jgi:hypothetical protein
MDQALQTCVQASSVPTLGLLYPLSVELFVDAATGNVGIGTLAPQSKLQVEGEMRVPSGSDVSPSGGGYLQLGSATGKSVGIDDNEIMARNAGSGASLSLNAEGGDVLIGGSSSSGRLGEGTSSPKFDVHVRGDGALGTLLVTPNVTDSSAELRLTENHTATLGMLMRYNGSLNDLEVRGINSSGETGVHFFVDRDSGFAGFPTSAARVGIGTASPAGQLHVSGSGGDGSVRLPGDAINQSEILGEMGVASDINVTGLTLKAGAAPSNLAGRTITVPTSGHVLALGSTRVSNLNVLLETSVNVRIRWSQTGKESVLSPCTLEPIDTDTLVNQGLFAVSGRLSHLLSSRGRVVPGRRHG